MERSLKQVLTLNKILRLANPDSPQEWFNSVMRPPAQSTTLYGDQKAREQLRKHILSLIDPKSKLPPIIKAVIELMFINGLRISEVLNIKGTDISDIGNIFINSSKGSQSRWVTPGTYRMLWIAMRQMKEPLGTDYSRFFFYREFKKLGIHYLQEGNINASVTHAFRHILVSSNQDTQHELVYSKNQLGHKSINSTKHYDSTKKRTKAKKNK